MKIGSLTFSASLKVFPSIICFGSSNKFTKVLIIEVSSALSKFKSFINNGSKIESRIASLEIVSSSRLRKLAWSIRFITVIMALEVWFADMNEFLIEGDWLLNWSLNAIRHLVI